ncbi:MAG: hypothetical protein WCL21_14330 [Mariniphaga sp.]
MKNLRTLLFVAILFAMAAVSNAQSVGINSDGSTPNSSAMLDVTSTNKGFLPPRVTLTGTTDVSTIASPATGLFVYNTATAGTSPSNVTPGLYYYDGSKWQRIINQQPDATIEFNQLTPTTAGVVFTPNTPASKDYVYVSTVDNSQWTYNGSIYVTYTPPASTAWNLAGGTTDAGSNKTGAISRTGNVGVGTTPTVRLDARATTGDGAVGIGTSSATASTTGAGALRYSTSSGGILEYSNGTAWNTLTSTVTKSTVIASKSSAQTIIHNTSATVAGWTEIVDNNNTFNPSTGVFTAPRTGNYVFNFSYAFSASNYSSTPSVIEAWMQCSDGTKLRKQLLAAPISATNQRCGALISFVVNLISGQTLSAAIWHDTGADRSLEFNGGGAGFVNISIVEL